MAASEVIAGPVYTSQEDKRSRRVRKVAARIPIIRSIVLIAAGGRHESNRIAGSLAGSQIGSGSMNREHVEDYHLSCFDFDVDCGAFIIFTLVKGKAERRTIARVLPVLAARLISMRPRYES